MGPCVLAARPAAPATWWAATTSGTGSGPAWPRPATKARTTARARGGGMALGADVAGRGTLSWAMGLWGGIGYGVGYGGWAHGLGPRLGPRLGWARSPAAKLQLFGVARARMLAARSARAQFCPSRTLGASSSTPVPAPRRGSARASAAAAAAETHKMLDRATVVDRVRGCLWGECGGGQGSGVDPDGILQALNEWPRCLHAATNAFACGHECFCNTLPRTQASLLPTRYPWCGAWASAAQATRGARRLAPQPT